MHNERYLATVGWDGYDEYTDGEVTIMRHNSEDLVEGVEEYLEQYSERSPYIECASIEITTMAVRGEVDNNIYSSRDITELIKTKIKTKENHGK